MSGKSLGDGFSPQRTFMASRCFGRATSNAIGALMLKRSMRWSTDGTCFAYSSVAPSVAERSSRYWKKTAWHWEPDIVSDGSRQGARGAAHLVVEVPKRLEVRDRADRALLARGSDRDKQRHREARGVERFREARLGVPERYLLVALSEMPDVGLVEDLVAQELAPGKLEHLGVHQIREGRDVGHARDELAEDDQVLRVPGRELVDEVLKNDRYRRRHRNPAAVQLPGERREAWSKFLRQPMWITGGERNEP